MTNQREEWYDKDAKVAVTIVDVTAAAQALARGHLCGPTSAYFLSRALASAALLGAEMSEKDETLILQMKCEGPLGGFNVECTAAGTLRGYTEKKTLDDFDGLGTPDVRKVVGKRQVQVTRSVPGRIISQGISNSLDGYLAGSLQRKAVIYTGDARRERHGCAFSQPSRQVALRGARRLVAEHPREARAQERRAAPHDAALVRLPLLSRPRRRDARGPLARGARVASADDRRNLPHVRQDVQRQDILTSSRRASGSAARKMV